MINIIPAPILVLYRDYPSKINNVINNEHITPKNCPPNNRDPEDID
jgi:hypothetical protein